MAEINLTPKCAHCGCRRSEVVDIRERFGMSSEYRRCLNPNCRRHFSAEPTVQYDSDPVRCVCQNCGGKNPAVYRTMPRKDAADPTIRYHKCSGCGYTFKSVEST